MEVVVRALRAVRDAIVGFAGDTLTAVEAARLVEEIARTEKALAAVRARVAAQAVDAGAHRARGFADGADWLAAVSGSTRSEVRSSLAAAAASARSPDVDRAVVAGDISLAQAAAIIAAAEASPGCEARLVAFAAGAGLGPVRDAARRVALAAADSNELQTRQRKARYLRHWRDELGMVCLSAALPPDVGVPLVTRLDAETSRLRRGARRAGGQAEPTEAYAADALIRMASGTARAGGRRADVVVVCDLRAYRRGHAHVGEPCHIVGGGPLPVHAARDLIESGDAFVKAVVHDGVEVRSVVHLGRHIKAEIRTALELGAPPGFDGVECIEPACHWRRGLEWDHANPMANGGETSLANLVPRCWPHHVEKTERDRRAGRLRRARRQERGPP